MNKEKRRFSIKKSFNQVDIKSFIICTFIMFATYFTGGLLIIEDKEISLYEILIHYRSAINRITRYGVMAQQYTEWYHFILPILLCVPTTLLIGDVIRNKTYRFYLIRENIKSYFIQTYLVSVISALLMVLLSTLPFVAIVYGVFPTKRDWGIMHVTSQGELDYIKVYFQRLPYELVNVVFLTSLSYFWSVLVVNRYSVITFSFLISYLMSGYADRINIVILIILSLFLKDLSYVILRWRCLNR